MRESKQQPFGAEYDDNIFYDHGAWVEREDDLEIKVSPARRFGTPTIQGISYEVVVEAWWAGEDPEEIWNLSRRAVLTACWFAGMHGRPSERRMYGEWAAQNQYALGRVEDINSIPLPPRN